MLVVGPGDVSKYSTGPWDARMSLRPGHKLASYERGEHNSGVGSDSHSQASKSHLVLGAFMMVPPSPATPGQP